jgi:hypothetical protein
MRAGRWSCCCAHEWRGEIALLRLSLFTLSFWRAWRQSGVRAFSELLLTEATYLSGSFLEKKPPFTALKKSAFIPKMF